MPLFNDAIQQIITSASVPSNPTQGLLWNEIDTNNNLVETWIYHATTSKWRSQLKSARSSNVGTANTVFYHALDSRYDWLLLEWIVGLATLKTMISGDSLIAYLDRSPSSATPTVLKSATINNLSVNQFYGSANTINLIISPSTATATTLRVLINCIGNTPSYVCGTELKYQLIRK